MRRSKITRIDTEMYEYLDQVSKDMGNRMGFGEPVGSVKASKIVVNLIKNQKIIVQRRKKKEFLIFGEFKI